MYFSDFPAFALTYCTPLVKNQGSFYEIRSLVFFINTRAFNCVNRKQLNVLKTFLEYLEKDLLEYCNAFWR